MIAPQLASAVRLVVVFVGGILVSQGFLTQAQLDFASDTTLLTGIIGAIGAIAAAGYGIWKRRPAGIIADAAKLPEVKRVVTDLTTAEAIPSSKVSAS